MKTNKAYYLLILTVFLLMGCAAAPTRLGLKAYEEGNYAKAIDELKPYAEQGDIESQWLLGSSYANAEPPVKNLAEAEKWIRKAADRNHADAMVDMAQLNLFYKPVADEAAAVSWYRKAADRGHPEAQFMIGSYYYSGEGGIGEDYVTAYMWWILAAAQGHPLAQLMLEKSKEKISQPQIDEAIRRAQEWKPIE